jgi:NADPH-dependent glutamate synthase beta subunit-like oxidoreductase/ferredoxin
MARSTKPSAVVAGVRRALLKGTASMTFEGDAEPLDIRPIPDSACRVACPAGVNVKAYIGLIAARDFDRALGVVRAHNPLPGICGRVCTHPCEAECRRGEVDSPVAIRPLKRFIADRALSAPHPRLPEGTPERGKRVAIVGSGPAGVTAANDLARLGYDITVLEALPKLGGMLRVGIPAFRLPHEIIDHEVNSMAGLGVKFETRSRVGDPAELLKDDFDAVFYAIGAHRDLDLGIEEEDRIEGVMSCIEFLREASLGRPRKLSGRVVVVGGGNSAIDSARTARRLGAREVRIVYRRTRKEMPADHEEVEEALAEGIAIDFQVQPVGLVHDDGRLSAVRCIRTRLGKPDASGRRRPESVEGSEFDIPAWFVIKAIGQRPETGHLADSGIPLTRWDTVEADENTCCTPVPGLFAGGDVVTGPSTVIDAVAAGHRAARAIHDYLSGRESTKPGPAPGNQEAELVLPALTAVTAERARPRTISPRSRRGFREVERTFSESEAVEEAQRCLRCGPCEECVRCSVQCPRRQVTLYVPGSTDEILVRVPSLDTLFPDPRASRAAVVNRPRAKPVRIRAAPVLARVDAELCRACGSCIEVCPHDAIRLVDWRAGNRVAEVDVSRCRGCGNCFTICPSGALSDQHQPGQVADV